MNFKEQFIVMCKKDLDDAVDMCEQSLAAILKAEEELIFAKCQYDITFKMVESFRNMYEDAQNIKPTTNGDNTNETI